MKGWIIRWKSGWKHTHREWRNHGQIVFQACFLACFFFFLTCHGRIGRLWHDHLNQVPLSPTPLLLASGIQGINVKCPYSLPDAICLVLWTNWKVQCLWHSAPNLLLYFRRKMWPILWDLEKTGHWKTLFDHNKRQVSKWFKETA